MVEFARGIRDWTLRTLHQDERLCPQRILARVTGGENKVTPQPQYAKIVNKPASDINNGTRLSTAQLKFVL